MDKHNKASSFFLRTLPKMINRDIDCIALGRVIKYDKSQHEADVQPLPLDKDGNKRTPFNYCVVPSSIYQTDKSFETLEQNPRNHFHGYKPMKVGSLVVVGACDREIDNLNTQSKDNYKIGTKRMHSFNDSVILGVVTP